MNKWKLEKAKDKKHKFKVINYETGKEIYFGAYGYSDFRIHKDKERKKRYIERHKKNENWLNANTAGFWSRWLLWNKPTLKESIENIKTRFNQHIFSELVK